MPAAPSRHYLDLHLIVDNYGTHKRPAAVSASLLEGVTRRDLDLILPEGRMPRSATSYQRQS